MDNEMLNAILKSYLKIIDELKLIKQEIKGLKTKEKLITPETPLRLSMTKTSPDIKMNEMNIESSKMEPKKSLIDNKITMSEKPKRARKKKETINDTEKSIVTKQKKMLIDNTFVTKTPVVRKKKSTTKKESLKNDNKLESPAKNNLQEKIIENNKTDFSSVRNTINSSDNFMKEIEDEENSK